MKRKSEIFKELIIAEESSTSNSDRSQIDSPNVFVKGLSFKKKKTEKAAVESENVSPVKSVKFATVPNTPLITPSHFKFSTIS